MNRKLLIGPAGVGKTYALLGELSKAVEESGNPLEEDFYFVVPSSEHRERVLTLLVSRGVAGFFGERITTLSHLIPKLFQIEGPPVISNTARWILLKQILSQQEMPYFQAVKECDNFVSLLGRFILELKESLISPEIFREGMNALKTKELVFAAKYEALAAIYETYQTKLKAQGLRDSQDVLALYQKSPPQPRRLSTYVVAEAKKIKKIWLDGFFDFSALQLGYLEALLKMTESVTVTLTLDSSGAREDLFEGVLKTKKALEKLGFEPVFMKGPSKRTNQKDLRVLEQKLFCHPERSEGSKTLRFAQGDSNDNAIMIFEAVGMQGEMEMIAREIKKTIRDNDYRFSDFALLFRQIQNYEAVIRDVFERYEIPVEIHERERSHRAPLLHAVSSLFQVFKSEFNRYTLLRFLKSSFVQKIGIYELSPLWLNELEVRSLSGAELKTREDWLKPWTGNSRDKTLDTFNAKKTEILSELFRYEDSLRQAKTPAQLKKEILRLFHFVILSEAKDLDPSAAPQDDGCSKREITALKRLHNLLDEVERSYADSIPTNLFDSFSDLFLRLLEVDLYSLHERNKNCVQVYDISLARQKEYRTVFACGLLEGQFPILIKEDPILSDWERRLFNSTTPTYEVGKTNKTHPHLVGGGGLSERLPRQGMERYLFYLALTRASERLILTYPHFDQGGKEQLPSFYIDEVKAAFQKEIPVKRQSLARPYVDLEDCVDEKDLETTLMAEAWQSEKEAGPLIAYLIGEQLASTGKQMQFQKAFYEITAGIQDERVKQGDYFRTGRSSVTRLEEYGKCPFKYFSARVLQLQEPGEDENAKSKGSLLHRVLELYFSARLKEPLKFNSLEASRKFVLNQFEEVLKEFPLFYEKKFRRDMEIENLKRTLERFLKFELERLETARLKPRHFEFNFGVGPDPDAPGISLQLEDGKEVTLGGKIDRIDVDDKNEWALVVDYKSAAQFSKDDLALGTSLQLPLYLAAVEKFLKLKPVGAELYILKTLQKKGFYHRENTVASGNVISSRAFQLNETDFREVIERAFEFSRRYLSEMNQLKIPVRPRDCDKFCPYSAVCRIEKWKLPLILKEIKDEDANRAVVHERV